MVFAIVCNQPLNKLFLAVLANEIRKYENPDIGRHAMVTFVHPYQASGGACTLDQTREKFSIRDLHGEYAKLASSALRAEIVKCSDVSKDDAKKRLGCNARHAFVEHAGEGIRILDYTVDIITALYSLIDNSSDTSQDNGEEGTQTPAQKLYNAMKQTFIDSSPGSSGDTFQRGKVAEAAISYRILSTGAVDISRDTTTYADAFRKELTVYDISGSHETCKELSELKAKIKKAEAAYLKDGNLDAFDELGEFLFVSSAEPDRQVQFFTNLFSSFPMGERDGFASQVFRLMGGR